MKATAPEYLTENAQNIFQKVCEQLKEINKFHDVDVNLIAAYASEMDAYENLGKEIGNKKIMKSPNGYPLINPLISLRNTSLRNAKDIAQLIGIGPIPRVKVQNGEPHGVAPVTQNKLKTFQLKKAL